jgi:hypothetical protein
MATIAVPRVVPSPAEDAAALLKAFQGKVIVAPPDLSDTSVKRSNIGLIYFIIS